MVVVALKCGISKLFVLFGQQIRRGRKWRGCHHGKFLGHLASALVGRRQNVTGPSGRVCLNLPSRQAERQHVGKTMKYRRHSINCDADITVEIKRVYIIWIAYSINHVICQAI